MYIMCVYIYIYTTPARTLPLSVTIAMIRSSLHRAAPAHLIHDRNLYTTTNTCLQCLMQIMYTVF